MIRLIIVFILGCIVNQSHTQQHNFIFNGGVGDGFSDRRENILINNSIFNGYSNHGFAENKFQLKRNNELYNGGISDGWSIELFTVLNQNMIFSGDEDDGWSVCRFSFPNQHSIFEGGEDDGWANVMVKGKLNNMVFNGAEGDGFDDSGISKMTWTGAESDEWLIAANWNPKIVPGQNEVACIPKVPTQYPLLKTGQLGIGTQGTYACKKLFIEANAEMISQAGVNYRIYDLLELSGLIEFNKNGFNFVFIYGIGKLAIKNGGSFLMLEN